MDEKMTSIMFDETVTKHVGPNRADRRKQEKANKQLKKKMAANLRNAVEKEMLRHETDVAIKIIKEKYGVKVNVSDKQRAIIAAEREKRAKLKPAVEDNYGLPEHELCELVDKGIVDKHKPERGVILNNSFFDGRKPEFGKEIRLESGDIVRTIM